MEITERAIIEKYYWEGFEYKAIIIFLEEYHGIRMSMRTLLRRLASFGLRRRGQPASLTRIWRAITVELTGPGRFCGYRSLTRLLQRKHQLQATEESVRLILRQIDPVAVHNRRHHRLQRRTYSSRGPNCTWHIDGYDKLLPYGFGISGCVAGILYVTSASIGRGRCIDGYSRRIMWLECSSSNHAAGLVANYFMSCVTEVGGYPSSVRTDCGTENVLVAAIQSAAVQSPTAHVYGTSPGNQRIESWWSFFRRSHSQFWIDLFQTLIDANVFHPGHVKETDLLRFCFMHILQKHLHDVRRQWNTHRIRPSSNSRCPAGLPECLYRFPVHPAVNCLQIMSTALPPEITARLESKTTCQDDTYGEYLHYLCITNNFLAPTSIDEATSLYFKLLPFIRL